MKKNILKCLGVLGISVLFTGSILAQPSTNYLAEQPVGRLTKVEEGISVRAEQWKVTGTNVNLRSKPTSSSTSLGKLKQNEWMECATGTYKDSAGNYWKYSISNSLGVEGYVAMEYLVPDTRR